jgi:hypothetical protein
MKTKMITVALILISIVGCREEEINSPDIGSDGDPMDASMQVRVKFELTVGNIYYPNTDAVFRVKGYNEQDVEQWNQTFAYTAPQPNDLTLKTGFHHYRIEANVRGISTEQIFIGNDLWTERVREGLVPLTRVFTKSIEPKRIAYYVHSKQKLVNGSVVMVPYGKVAYEYNVDHSINAISYSDFDESNEVFVSTRQSKFSYGPAGVSKIITDDVNTDQRISVDWYTYEPSARLAHIKHQDFNSDITTEVGITYNENNRIINAAYSLSNGRAFEYEFLKKADNVISDRTTSGGELCSTGNYEYDKNINPLKHLGYVDYLFRNYSISNRLTESVEYKACGFPTLIPESYSYTYDADGYPSVVTTHYKNSEHTTQVEYVYQ